MSRMARSGHYELRNGIRPPQGVLQTTAPALRGVAEAGVWGEEYVSEQVARPELVEGLGVPPAQMQPGSGFPLQVRTRRSSLLAGFPLRSVTRHRVRASG